MTKEQVEKHGEVIKWFCDNADKGVWRKVKEWELIYRPIFDVSTIYVKNDEFAEYRKAEADGKQIQYRLYNRREWRDCSVDDRIFTQQGAKEYRIKPDFKGGDWVVCKKCNTKHQLTSKDGCSLDSIFCTGCETTLFREDIEMWTPVDEELCIFVDEDKEEYFLAKYNRSSEYLEDIGDYYFNELDWDFVFPIEHIKNLK